MLSHLKNSIFDALYCAEEHLDDDFSCGFGQKESKSVFSHENHVKTSPLPFENHDALSWDDDEFVTLLTKEKKQEQLSYNDDDEDVVIHSDGSLKIVRNQAVWWMLKVVAHYGFNRLTAVLAVNYYDRFVTSVSFQSDKPWMSQLTAVACLSLASKVEEIQVPMLLDFQVEDSKYVFEAKTIQRMELLVLSTLRWKMHPVTPIAYVDHIVRRFELVKKQPHWEFLRRCENVILSIITDCRSLHYLPSVIAAATMNYIVQEIDPRDAVDYQNQLMNVLRANKDEVDNCHKLIKELMDDSCPNLCKKRKFESMPSSPSGVVDAYFSSDSSNDSWSVASSVSPGPEHLVKRSRS